MRASVPREIASCMPTARAKSQNSDGQPATRAGWLTCMRAIDRFQPENAISWIQLTACTCDARLAGWLAGWLAGRLKHREMGSDHANRAGRARSGKRPTYYGPSYSCSTVRKVIFAVRYRRYATNHATQIGDILSVERMF
eukprot:COSAG05_NODE_1677_length_4292_cov_90.326735_4_plen_140_part_00